MNGKIYPLHPGQTHVEPMYATVPLEHYEQLKEESRNVAAIKASIEAILRELLDKDLLECWYFNGTYHATVRNNNRDKNHQP